MLIDENDYLEHYGILRRSGRYPWGSSSSQNVRNKSFLDYVSDMRAQGLTDTKIAEGVGISTTQLRAATTIAKTQQRQGDIALAQRLKDKGLSNVAIGQRMGRPESSVRAMLADGVRERTEVLQTTANLLKKQIAEKQYIDVGKGVENQLGISKEKLGAAVSLLQEEGYVKHYLKVPQSNTTNDTSLKVLTAPGTSYSEAYKNRDNIQQITGFSKDGGATYFQPQPPLKISPSRVAVKYGPEGGAKEDGVIYVRPGVSDVSLGMSNYAQVRVSVGNGHYLKGMAVYRDDLPDGVDLLFNTNKNDTGNKLDAMKPIEDDPNNPYGSSIKRQILVKDRNGNDKPTSVMNIVNEEGDWNQWSKSLSSQLLGKQSPSLAKAQLDMTYEKRLKEFEEISALTNPTVRKKLLETFGDSTDSAAVHLKAAALPRQRTQVILPIDIPETQVYAPNFRDGERVVLIRHPHAGTFEIPELTVNNQHPKGKALLKDAKDAIGINARVAERLSGADFDGDTVLVIPNNGGKVKTTPALDKLKGFDPRQEYKAYEGMPRMTTRTKGIEMGQISNLITDMTIQKASTEKIARAVKHSMVVIDAERHNLDYRRSAQENGISALKAEYQGSPSGGASTLLSRAGAVDRVPQQKNRTAKLGGPIDKETGKRVFEPTGKEPYVNKQGKVVIPTSRVKRLANTDDAFTLVSGNGTGTPIERIYAEHSNKLKALGNKARLDAVNTPLAAYSPSAAKTYKTQVDSLNGKLNVALKNAPLERQAQIIANTIVKAKQQANPDMDAASLKKEKARAQATARNRTGAKKIRVVIDPSEWEAIQAGAISDNKLKQILNNADLDVVKNLATPKTAVLMTPTKLTRATAMLSDGYTRAQVADALGVSLSTLDGATNE